MLARALVVLALLTTVAHADEQAFRAAGKLAANSDARALDAFEAAGAARPITRWTDDAWVEAARIAEQRRDYDRARRDLEQAIAVSTDAQLLRRARNDLARLVELTGGGGEWSAIAAEHQRLVTAIAGGGDPTAELAQLEAIAKANPSYPRGVALRIAIARAWETEDEVDRAFGWLRDALALGRNDLEPARVELVRMLIRHRRLDEARAELPLVADARTRLSLERNLSSGESWQRLRFVAIALLFAIGGLAIFLVRRRTGTWRAAVRQLVRPPVEVFYFVPIAAVLGLLATTGSPLVAKAVIAICASTAVIVWISGATLEAARRRGALHVRHVVVHALVAGVAIASAVYLSLDHARLLDLVVETWRTGPGK